MTDVAVITPSLPRRHRLLAEAISSVAAQTIPVEHLIYSDEILSVSEKRNRLIQCAGTEWVAFLDDDDLLDVRHIETLLEHASNADVVIPHCRFQGPPLPSPACCEGFVNRPFNHADLKDHGIFAITVLARRQSILDVGGFPSGDLEDWRLWKTLANAGARFEVGPEVTWTYRTSGSDRRTRELFPPPPILTVRRAKRALARRAPQVYDWSRRRVRRQVG